jgi:hypothetical protein
MLRRVIQILLFVAAFCALAYAWGAYGTFRELAYIFRRNFGDAFPIYASIDPIYLNDESVSLRLVTSIAITAVAVLISILAAMKRWPLWICLPLAFVSVIAIDVSVAQIRDGNDSFVAPYRRQGLEYFGDVPAVNDRPLQFIANYPSISSSLSHHAGTHPPGGVLFLWLGTKLFGESVDAGAWWSVCFGALGIFPTYWFASTILGSLRARRVLPLYLVTPSLVIFGATSMDIVFFAFAAFSLATMFWAMRRLCPMRTLIAGAAFWLAAFMSFAVITLPLIAGFYALAHAIRDPRKSLKLIGRLALVGLSFIFFQAIAGLLLRYDFQLAAQAAMHRDLRGVGVTGYENFEIWRAYSVGNIAAFLFGTGIALSAAMIVGLITIPLARPLVRRRIACLAIATPMCLIAITVSTLFTRETERVWLSVVPAMLIVAAGLRGWVIWFLVIGLLGVQSFLTECTLYTHW